MESSLVHDEQVSNPETTMDRSSLLHNEQVSNSETTEESCLLDEQVISTETTTESCLPDEQVSNSETTYSPNSLSMKPHDQHCGEIKDTHVLENGKPSKKYDVEKIGENGETSHGNEMLVEEIRGNELQHKDGESKVKGLSFVDPSVEDVMKTKGKGLLVQPVDFHSQGGLTDFRDNITPFPSPTATADAASTQNLMSAGNSEDAASNGMGFDYYKQLYKAARKGDWRSAEEFLINDPEAVNTVITRFEGTMLHVAAKSGRASFVLKLVALMDVDALALQDSTGDTALHVAAVGGMTEATKAMVTKNSNLTQIENKLGWTALHTCAAYAHNEQRDMNRMIDYLYNATRNEGPSMPFSGQSGASLLTRLTAGGFYDVAVKLVQKYPSLVTTKDEGGYTALYLLSKKASSFPSGSQLGFWGSLIYSMIPLQVDDNLLNCSGSNGNQVGFGDISNIGALVKSLTWTNLIKVPGIKQVYLKKFEHIKAMELLECICSKISLMTTDDIDQFFTENSGILATGSEYGVVELVIECQRIYPDLWRFSFNGGNILHIAVEHRKEKIFNLMDRMSAQKKIMMSHRVESSGNNILHLAAKLGPFSQRYTVFGAALQMQLDLQWFEEVGKIVKPIYKEEKNEDGLTPREFFTLEHEDLLGKGEKWMKDTAQSCMVVATLIATVMFAGIITVPGGDVSDGDNKGSPILLHYNAFMWFIISDALGLISSTTSVLMFLSILTARYAEEDFLKSLPKRLIIGLGTLFIAIAAMMVTFSAALYMVLEKRFEWASVPIAVIACLPVTLYALLQFPLLVKMYSSTYGVGLFHSDGKYKLD